MRSLSLRGCPRNKSSLLSWCQIIWWSGPKCAPGVPGVCVPFGAPSSSFVAERDGGDMVVVGGQDASSNPCRRAQPVTDRRHRTFEMR